MTELLRDLLADLAASAAGCWRPRCFVLVCFGLLLARLVCCR
jgi:hypothetical protein